MNAAYYREQAATARRFADQMPDNRSTLQQSLRDVAVRYDQVADDIEHGTVEIRPPDLHKGREAKD